MNDYFTNTGFPFYISFKTFIKSLLSNNIFLSLVLTIIVFGIMYISEKEQGLFGFSKYSKKIINFTNQAKEGSIITIVAGDMDFLGNVNSNNDDIKFEKDDLMENNSEYLQLVDKKETINGIKILCNNRLPNLLKKSIIKKTITAEDLYTEYRLNDSLKSESFQQLLRIGMLKSKFEDTIEFRFYNSDKEDKVFRARFLESRTNEIQGIIYNKKGKRKYFSGNIREMLQNIREMLQNKKKWTELFADEDLYSLTSLAGNQAIYYYDMFQLKWDSCHEDDSKLISNFCVQLYKYVTGEENKYKMALVYVNSYEIARKKEKRKEFPPFGVLYLATVVKKEGWDVTLFSVDENDYTRNFSDYDVVGFSIVSSYSYQPLMNCCKTSKMKRDVFKIAGGYQAEKFYLNVFRDFSVRMIFKGESEESIKEFVNNFKYRSFSDIKGIIYKYNDGKFLNTEERGCVDLNEIPIPNREFLGPNDFVMTDRLANTKLKMVHVLFSRGCIYNCAYCAAHQDGNNSKIRYRLKEKIVEELEQLKEQFKIEGFSIIDDCFLTNKEKSIEICNYIASKNLNLKWSLAARVDHIDDERLTALRNAGCIEIKFGAETGSNELLTKMKKGVTVSQIENAIRMTKSKGISVKLFLITGLPGETDTTHNETIEFLERMKDNIDRVSLLRYTPLAGSNIYENPQLYGIDKTKIGVEHFNKMSLYRKSHNWWINTTVKENCDRWFNEMTAVIEKHWNEDI